MKNRNYNIEVEFDKRTECYVVLVNGVTILECISFDELRDCSFEDFVRFYEEAESL